MRFFTKVVRVSVVFAFAWLTACGGGAGGGGSGGGTFALNGGPVSGSVSPASGGVSTYSFNVVADKAYTVSAVTLSGDVWLAVSYGALTTSGANLIGISSSSLSTTPLNSVSFIANTSGTVYVQVMDVSMSGSTYTLEAFSGDLTIGTTKSASTYNEPLYFSFDAVSGTAYEVQLTPQTGNVDIGSVNAKLTASVGSSLLAGTNMDSVVFLASSSQRYYVRVDPTSVDSNFGIKVVTTSTQPDLRVVLNSAVSDTQNVTLDYTVYNQGLNASGAFDVAFWSNATSAPSVGATGQATATIASLAGGASANGSIIIPNTGNGGTAYAVVDTTNAVVEKNETNNVSVGKTWLKPLQAPQSFNFENALIPAAMTMSGNAAWTMDATNGSASTHSIKSGMIGNSQTSCTAMMVANVGAINFDYAVSSELGFDMLRFYIDGVQSRSWSGTVPWTATGAIAVTSGVHEFKWCYTKDMIMSSGSDTAWIDNIVVSPAAPDLQVVVDSAVSDGTYVTVNYTVNNIGVTAAGSFRVDAWTNPATVPVVGAAGEGYTTIASLAAGATTTGSLVIPNAAAAAAGTAYAIVDTINSVAETNETNNVSAGAAWAIPLQTINFEDGLVPAALVMTGNLPWLNVAGGPVGSTRALQAGTITHAQTSCVQFAPASSSSISFDYSVSSESGYDFLLFYIDGVQTRSWSGVVPWTNSGTISAGTTGAHTYKWCYSKDASVNANLDTAWIDRIVIY